MCHIRPHHPWAFLECHSSKTPSSKRVMLFVARQGKASLHHLRSVQQGNLERASGYQRWTGGCSLRQGKARQGIIAPSALCPTMQPRKVFWVPELDFKALFAARHLKAWHHCTLCALPNQEHPGKLPGYHGLQTWTGRCCKGCPVPVLLMPDKHSI